MATSEGIPSSIDIEFLELNDNPYLKYYNIFAHNITPDSLLLRQVWLRGSDGHRRNGG